MAGKTPSSGETTEYGQIIELRSEVRYLTASVDEIKNNLTNTYVSRDALSLIIQKLEAAAAARSTALEDRVRDIEKANEKKAERDKFWVRLVVGGVVLALVPELLALLYYLTHIRTQS